MELAPPKPLSVTQLTALIKRALEVHVGLSRVEGEISNWKVSPQGHAYFNLKDATAAISCVMFRSALARTRFEARNGMQIVLEGRLSVYEARGQYQIIADRITEAGIGLLFQKFNELKAKLDAEGLFRPERKKKIPMLPQRLGIVTSLHGAAIRDILNVLKRRFSKMQIIIAPVRVQGVEAAPEIAVAIRRFNAMRNVDVLIVGRGGGSIEDLWPFNEELVARAIAESQLPIVSAVGHETDFTIADFVADLRAPTPSAAAELVVGEYAQLCQRIDVLAHRLQNSLCTRLEHARLRVARLTGSYGLRRPLDLVSQTRQRIDGLTEELRDALRQNEQDCRRKMETLEARLYALNPKAVLARGYAIITRARDAHVVIRPGQVRNYEQVKIELSEGQLRATVVPDQDDFLSGAI